MLYWVTIEIPKANPLFYTLFYAGMIGMTLLMMKLCFEVEMKEVLFAGVCGYATQHIAFALSTIIQQMTGIVLNVFWDYVIFRFLPYILTAVLVYIVFIRRYNGKWEIKDRDIRMIILALVILFSVVFLSIMVDSSVFSDDNAYLRNVFCKIYAIMRSFLAIFVGFYLTRQNRILHEKEMMEEMLHNLKEQQKLFRENINIINIKCHDLKYRISKIAKIEDREYQNEYIESVKKAVAIYDNIYQTGNDAMDLVLMEKSLLCDEHQIKLTCMVDGEILGFMDTTDVYALMGNALDNAIESVIKEPDKEKRIISVCISRRNQGVHIHIDNYCNEILQFENGLPVTTKNDKAYHGFGVKSIRYITEKYKGDLLMQIKDQRFQLDIIFYDSFQSTKE